jgi:hypothetical protein
MALNLRWPIKEHVCTWNVILYITFIVFTDKYGKYLRTLCIVSFFLTHLIFIPRILTVPFLFVGNLTLLCKLETPNLEICNYLAMLTAWYGVNVRIYCISEISALKKKDVKVHDDGILIELTFDIHHVQKFENLITCLWYPSYCRALQQCSRIASTCSCHATLWGLSKRDRTQKTVHQNHQCLKNIKYEINVKLWQMKWIITTDFSDNSAAEQALYTVTYLWLRD